MVREMARGTSMFSFKSTPTRMRFWVSYGKRSRQSPSGLTGSKLSVVNVWFTSTAHKFFLG